MLKTSISYRLFSTYFQPIHHVYEKIFSKHNFKQSNAFSKHLKIFLNYQGLKVWYNFLNTAEKISSVLPFLKEG